MSSYSIRTSASDSAYHYHSIFGDICSTRFGKLARLLAIASWALTLITSLGSSKSWWSTTILPIWALPNFLGFFLLACLRKNNLHVDFLGYKTLSSQIIGQIFNKKFIISVVFYTISSFIFFVLLHSQFGIIITAIARKHQYPPLNDQFVFYYFMSAYVALFYSLQHSVFDKDRLVFTYGNFHNHPRQAIINKAPVIVSATILLSVLSITSGTFLYFFVRYWAYDFVFVTLGLLYSLNRNYPSFNVSFFFWIKLSIISSILIFSWELVNAAFNAYMSIGCLHRGHTLSELSSDPLGTLITGLKSDKLFTKLTAFQELAFIAKIDDKEHRLAIYNRNNRREFAWGEILQECEKVIKINNINVLRSLTASVTPEAIVPIESTKRDTRDQHIFGREYYSVDPHRKEDEMFQRAPINPTIDSSSTFLDTTIIPVVITNIKEIIALTKLYYFKFITSGFGMPFRHTATREAEFLCPTPVIVGNAIIAISLLGTHAYEEDKKGTVSSTITDILEILEKSVSACGRFVQSPPAQLVETDDDNLITLLHELSMNAFFEVTVQYNSVLKDLVLSPDVYRLVNWTLETALREESVEAE